MYVAAAINACTHVVVRYALRLWTVVARHVSHDDDDVDEHEKYDEAVGECDRQVADELRAHLHKQKQSADEQRAVAIAHHRRRRRRRFCCSCSCSSSVRPRSITMQSGVIDVVSARRVQQQLLLTLVFVETGNNKLSIRKHVRVCCGVATNQPTGSALTHSLTHSLTHLALENDPTDQQHHRVVQ